VRGFGAAEDLCKCFRIHQRSIDEVKLLPEPLRGLRHVCGLSTFDVFTRRCRKPGKILRCLRHLRFTHRWRPSVLSCAWLINAEIRHGGSLAGYVVAYSKNLTYLPQEPWVVPKTASDPIALADFVSPTLRGTRKLLKSTLPKDRNVASLGPCCY
jgi:hypothetical protein